MVSMARRRLPPDQRRAAILVAAREVFGRHSYAAVSMADIASAAGVTAPLIVFYFGSKPGLYREVIQAAADSLQEGLQAVPGPASLERLHQSVLYYVRYAGDHRAGFLSLLRSGQESPLPEVTDVVENLRASVCERILADLAAAEPAAGEREPLDIADPALRVAVRGYLGFVDTAIVHWLSLHDAERQRVPADAVARAAAGAFIGSIDALRPADRTGSSPDQPAVHATT
jgi:AcrR family transcriptional regulator